MVSRPTCRSQDWPTRTVEYLLYAQQEREGGGSLRHDRHENYYDATFEGVVTNLERRYRETESEWVRTELEKYMVERPCPTCAGTRLKPDALSVTVDDRNIAQVSQLSVTESLTWAEVLPNQLTDRETSIDARCSRRSAPAWASWSTSGWTT